MIRFLFTLAAFISFYTASAQIPVSEKEKASPLDQSPLDMAYYPNDYTILKSQDKIREAPLARVIFSRPQKNNRKVFGELIEFNEVWRLGANEATEIEFFKDVKIGGKKVLKGRYTLYAIPDSTAWTIIINKDTDVWGAFKYDEKKDVARVKVPASKTQIPVEVFTMDFSKTGNNLSLNIAWDDVMVKVPIGL
jgi:hypothetical protein